MSRSRWVVRSHLAFVLVVLVAVSAVGGAPGASGSSTSAASSGPPSADAPASTAAGENRAVVVIDDGTHRTQTCVTFDESEISGVDALQRTGAAIEERRFGGMGDAVCKINGMGCGISDCLTCKAPAFWNYFRAPAGENFRRWGVGASQAKVRDGDVEAWVWGSGPGAPPLPSVDSVCGIRPPPPAPAPAPSPSPTPAPGADPPAAVVPSEVQDPTRSDAASSGGDHESTTVPGETTTSASAVDQTGDRGDDLLQDEEVDGDAVAATAALDQGGSSGPPWGSILAFTLIAAALGSWAFVVRRRRTVTP